MKKNYAIITENLMCEPGIYGINVTEEQVKEFKRGTGWSEALNFEWEDLIWTLPLGVDPGLLAKIVYKKFLKKTTVNRTIEKKELKRIYKFPKKENCIGDSTNLNFDTPFIDKGILIPSSFLNANYELYNDKIFHSVFKTKEELELILPHNDNFNLYILSKKYAQTLFNGNIHEGLHVLDLEYNSLFPVNTYQKSKWNIYQEAIMSIFSNLGAKKLIIKEEKEFNTDAGAEVDSTDVNCSASVNIKHIIDFEWSSEEPIYNIEIAQRNLYLLKEIKLFHDLAFSLIEQKRSMNIKKTELISFDFGINANIIECFEVKGKVSINKKLYIEFSF